MASIVNSTTAALLDLRTLTLKQLMDTRVHKKAPSIVDLAEQAITATWDSNPTMRLMLASFNRATSVHGSVYLDRAGAALALKEYGTKNNVPLLRDSSLFKLQQAATFAANRFESLSRRKRKAAAKAVMAEAGEGSEAA